MCIVLWKVKGYYTILLGIWLPRIYLCIYSPECCVSLCVPIHILAASHSRPLRLACYNMFILRERSLSSQRLCERGRCKTFIIYCVRGHAAHILRTPAPPRCVYTAYRCERTGYMQRSICRHADYMPRCIYVAHVISRAGSILQQP